MLKIMLNLMFCFCALNATEKPVIVFDFGGVIAEANVVQMKAFLLQSFQINKDELSLALRNMQKSISQGKSEQAYWEEYAASKNIILPKDWIVQFGSIIDNSITLFPDTIALVKALQSQGYQTAMLSDVTEYQAKIIRKMGYYDLFHPVLLSYEIGVQKPNPEAFKILISKLQTAPSNIIFIDDRFENVEAAKALGIDAIQFLSAQQLQTDLEKRLKPTIKN